MKRFSAILICLALLLTISISAYAERYYKSSDVEILWDFEDGNISNWTSDGEFPISVESIGINNKALKLDYNFADITAKTYWDKAQVKINKKIDLSEYKAITFDVILDPAKIKGDGHIGCCACYCTEGYASFKSLEATNIGKMPTSSGRLARIKCTSPISDVGMIEQVLIWIVGANIDYDGPCYIDNVGLAKTLAEDKEAEYIEPPFKTPVEKHGQLHVDGIHLCDEKGEPVQLMGMSYAMMLANPEFVTRDTFQAMAFDWKCDVVRLTVDIEGSKVYTGSDEDKALICKAADLAIETGMYFLLDWHGLNDGNPLSSVHSGAGEFFDYFSKKYADVPNIIYEVFNEPNGKITWAGNVKPYAENMIKIIRANDPDSVIVVGCCNWSQDVNECADNPINEENIMYTLHFYSGTHQQPYRDKAQYAIDKGIALFATEWGLTSCTGSAGIFVEESEKWLELLDKYQISWSNWCLHHSAADSTVILPLRNVELNDEYGFDLMEPVPQAPDHISDEGYPCWPEEELSFCGNYIRNRIRDAHPEEEIKELSITSIELEKKTGNTYSVTVETVGGTTAKRYSYYLIGEGKVLFKEVYSKNSSTEFTVPDSGNYTLRVYVDDANGKRVVGQKEI